MSSKILSQIFIILFQTGDINIFVLCDVFFSTYVPLQLKSSFSDEKNISGDVRKLTWQSIKKQNSIIGSGSWSSPKLFIVQDYSENVNGDVSLIVKNVSYF